MPIDRVEPEPPHRARERVERAPHIERLDGDEHADRRRQAQHERNIATTRRSVSSRKSSPNSIDAVPIRSAYRAALGTLGAATSSTSPGDIGESCARGVRPERSTRPPADARVRFSRHAFSERPSTPCARAHVPIRPPAARTAARHARASRSSSIFRSFATRHLREAPQAGALEAGDHPGVADGSHGDGYADLAEGSVSIAKSSRVIVSSVLSSPSCTLMVQHRDEAQDHDRL